jgi:hypothetical protein
MTGTAHLPEPISLARDVAITFLPWDGGLAALLEVGGLTVTLAEDVTGELRLTDWGDGDMRVEPVGDVDYLASAADLLAGMGRVDEDWRSPNGRNHWVRVGQWVLTIVDTGASSVEHVCCPSAVDASALLADWVVDTGGPFDRQDPYEETPL